MDRYDVVTVLHLRTTVSMAANPTAFLDISINSGLFIFDVDADNSRLLLQFILGEF
jgi:hypothetical protein